MTAGMHLWGSGRHASRGSAWAWAARRQVAHSAECPLERLLAPLSKQHFASSYFGEDWLLAPHSADVKSQATAHWVASLFQLQDLGEQLSFAGIAVDGASLRNDSCQMDAMATSALLGGSKRELPALAQQQLAFAAGHAVTLGGLHLSPGPVARLAGSIARDLGVLVRVAAHLEPPGAQARAPCSPWSRLLTQTHGMSMWRFSGDRGWGATERAMDEPPGIPARVALRPGDVLYIPSYLVAHRELGNGPSLQLEFQIHEQHYTWAALLSSVCRRLDRDWEAERPLVEADGLDEVLVREAARVPMLGSVRVRAPWDMAQDPWGSCLPAVLQQMAHLPGDLPRGWLDELLGQLRALAGDLCEVGHVDCPVNLRVAGARGRSFAAQASARAVLKAAHDAAETELRSSLLWALVELRRRSAQEATGLDSGAFASLGHAFCEGRDLSSLLLERSRHGVLLESTGGERELSVGATRARIPAELAAAAEWCLGRWSGARGRPFRLGRVPGDPSVSRRAAKLLLHLGALRVQDPVPSETS